MINKPPPFKGLDSRIPIIIPTKGRGFIHQGSTLNCKALDAKSYFPSFAQFPSLHVPDDVASRPVLGDLGIINGALRHDIV